MAHLKAIVLAAGLSTRFHGNKLLYSVCGTPLIVRAITSLIRKEEIGNIVVVTGHMREEVEETIKRHFMEHLEGGRITAVYNPLFREGGMSSSVKRGLEVIDKGSDILVLPGDVGCLSESTIDEVIEKYKETSWPILVACLKGRHGHPIIFRASLRGELEAIGEDSQGLKEVVKNHIKDVYCVETEDPGVLLDIDTSEDVRKCEDLLRGKNLCF